MHNEEMRHNAEALTAIIRHRRTAPPEAYSDRPVPREVIERIVDNAVWAPTHKMTQPWRFTVFTGEGRARLAHFMGAEYKRTTPPGGFKQRKYDKHAKRPLQSSVVIALGLARDPRVPLHEEQFSVACAVQNMYLTCASYGLLALWNTGPILTGNAMAGFLGLGPDDHCLGLFYIGYPAGEWPKGFRKPLNELVHWVPA